MWAATATAATVRSTAIRPAWTTVRITASVVRRALRIAPFRALPATAIIRAAGPDIPVEPARSRPAWATVTAAIASLVAPVELGLPVAAALRTTLSEWTVSRLRAALHLALAVSLVLTLVGLTGGLKE